MIINDIKSICVIGAGNMGHQISLHLALFGFNTVYTDISTDALRKAEEFAHSYLKERVAKGKLSEVRMNDTLGNLRFTPDLKHAAGAADYVIEAAVEKIDIIIHEW